MYGQGVHPSGGEYCSKKNDLIRKVDLSTGPLSCKILAILTYRLLKYLLNSDFGEQTYGLTVQFDLYKSQQITAHAWRAPSQRYTRYKSTQFPGIVLNSQIFPNSVSPAPCQPQEVANHNVKLT